MGGASKPGGHWEDEFGVGTRYSVLFRINGFVFHVICFSWLQKVFHHKSGRYDSTA